jgi:hypothetical protein
MGTQSGINPMREPARRGGTCGAILRLCAARRGGFVRQPCGRWLRFDRAVLWAAGWALWMGISLVAVGGAQAQTSTLPLVLPSAIAFDAQGNLYIADTGDNVVRKVSVGGVISTEAGTGVQGFGGDNGPATAAELDSPMGLAVDAAGDLYIADSHNHRIREVAAATGVITTVAGAGGAWILG